VGAYFIRAVRPSIRIGSPTQKTRKVLSRLEIRLLFRTVVRKEKTNRAKIKLEIKIAGFARLIALLFPIFPALSCKFATPEGCSPPTEN